MVTHDKVKVAVVGASGYSGIEAVRILSSHPFVELSVLTSEHYAGREVADVYRHMAGVDLPPFEELRPDLVQGRAEVAISCLPETVGTAHTAELIKAGVKVVDLSADYRFKDAAQFRTTYGIEHPAPQLLKEAVYGLSEFHRHELREARLVATPGCFPTGALLALLPLIRRDLIEPSSIIIDAKSGTTGARRAASIEQLFAEVNENFRAYKVGNHRHVPEMEQEISAALGRDIALLFVPHLLPITRGLLSSIFMRPRAGTTESDVHAAFEASFAKSRFVRILKPGELPELRNVRATNYCELAFILDRRSETLLVLTAIDNLGKGASGQAVQNMNLMLGYDEAAGLLNAAPVPLIRSPLSETPSGYLAFVQGKAGRRSEAGRCAERTDSRCFALLTYAGQTANVLAVQSEIVASGQERRSFIENARRAQIIECAISAIAELGYTKASLAEIAKRAGVSKGVISYHFAGKRELMQQVVNTVMEQAGAVMLPRIFAEHSAAGMLRAYIESNIEFINTHRNHIMAVINISGGARGDDGKPMVDLTLAFEPAVSALENLLRSGQEQGEFREFSTRVMAVTIRNAIDAVSLQLAAYPDLDLKIYANELATLFNVATRK